MDVNRNNTFAIGFYVLDAEGNVLTDPMGRGEAEEARLSFELSGLYFCSIVWRSPNGQLEQVTP